MKAFCSTVQKFLHWLFCVGSLDLTKSRFSPSQENEYIYIYNIYIYNIYINIYIYINHNEWKYNNKSTNDKI